MSPEQPNAGTPASTPVTQNEPVNHVPGARVYAAPNPPAGEESSATSYIAAQVQQARAALQRTRLFGIIALLLLGGEMIYLTARFSSSLQPHAAAEIADGMIMQQINDRGPEVANELKRRIPEYIRQTPDYALKQLPGYRVAIEDRLEAQLSQYCKSASKQFDQQLDRYLTEHKDDIKGMISTGSDPAVTKRVGQDLKQQLIAFTQEKIQGGESIQDQLNTALAALQGTSATMHRLAVARDLNPQEKQTRRALAILTQSLAIR